MAQFGIKVLCTGNNTIATVRDKNKCIKTISAGRLGFKGPRRGSRHAAEMVGRDIGRICQSEAHVLIEYSGHRLTVSSLVRGLRSRGVKIDAFDDITPIPHNGCRRRKPRRV